METVTFKLEENILKRIDKLLTKFNFSTRTEFIRDAIRDKLEILDNRLFIAELSKYKGMSKKHTTDKEIHKIREEIFNRLATK